MTLALNIPTLKTERLMLRVPSSEDINAMTRFYAETRSEFYGGPKTSGESWRDLAARAGQWVLLGYGMFAIILKESRETIGFVGPVHPADFPEPEMSWLITEARFEGKGYAREATEAALAFAFDNLGWASVASYIDHKNHASRALAQRLGAQLDPTSIAPISNCETYRHFPQGGCI